MSKKRKAKRWTAEVARRELSEWQRSGLSLTRYCARQGYQAQRLSWWKQRLRVGEASSVAPVALAPAVVTRPSRCAVALALSPDGSVRVEVADAEAVHPAWLGELVGAVRRSQ